MFTTLELGREGGGYRSCAAACIGADEHDPDYTPIVQQYTPTEDEDRQHLGVLQRHVARG